MPRCKETLQMFFEEKRLPPVTWEFTGEDGRLHLVDSKFIESMIVDHCSTAEQKAILDVIVRIDFANGDVNHFLRHLAEGYVKSIPVA